MTDTVSTPDSQTAYSITASMREADRLARRLANHAAAGCLPGESIMAATLRQSDQLSGSGLTEADRQAMTAQTVSELRETVANKQAEIDSLQEQLAALRIEAEFDFSARCALHSQVCRYGQALTLIANLPVADDGYRAVEQLRTARALANKAIHATEKAASLPAGRVSVVQVGS